MLRPSVFFTLAGCTGELVAVMWPTEFFRSLVAWQRVNSVMFSDATWKNWHCAWSSCNRLLATSCKKHVLSRNSGPAKALLNVVLTTQRETGKTNQLENWVIHQTSNLHYVDIILVTTVDNLHDLSLVNQWYLSKLMTLSLVATEIMYEICLVFVHGANYRKVKFYLRLCLKIPIFRHFRCGEKNSSAREWPVKCVEHF